MIVALLVVIILILLFGAGLVKGWIANIIGLGCGGLLILAALLWLGSFFGENGPTYVIYAFCGAGLVLALAAAIYQADEKKAKSIRGRSSRRSRSTNRRPRRKAEVVAAPRLEPVVPNDVKPAPPQPSKPAAIERVWGWFAEDIALRFTPEARAEAHRLYDADDEIGLDRFCRGQKRRR